MNGATSRLVRSVIRVPGSRLRRTPGLGQMDMSNLPRIAPLHWLPGCCDGQDELAVRSSLKIDTCHQRRYISTTRRKKSAVFSRWSQPNSHRSNTHSDLDHFMAHASLEEKEAWLQSLLEQETAFRVNPAAAAAAGYTGKSLQNSDGLVSYDDFLVILKALANSSHPAAPRRAERWLIQLKEHPRLKPDTAAYQAVVEAWANCNTEHPIVLVNRAERWLHEVLEADCDDLKPTVELYNAFLDACTRGRAGPNKKNRRIVYQNAQKADAILRRLHSEYHHFGGSTEVVVPTTESFNYVLRGWTRCKFDTVVHKRVLSLLRLMESYQREDPMNAPVRPNTKSYSIVMNALINTGREKAKQLQWQSERGEDSTEIKLDDKHRNGLNELEEAEAILQYMHDLHEAGVEGVVPHRVPYNILITGWAHMADHGHKNAPLQAEAVLRRMIDHQNNGFLEASPDKVSYEKVMLAWCNSDHPNAGKRALFWLKNLWNDSELQGRTDLIPTTQTYNIAMKAVGKCEGALEAENLLLDLGDKYREGNDATLCPNSESFATVIKAWLQQASEQQDVDEKIRCLNRAVEWLTSLREVENENNLSTAPELYHGVLRTAKSCARYRPEILDLAQHTFQNLLDSRHAADSLSYAWLLATGLEALSSQDRSEERTHFVEDLINSCREEGLLSNLVVQFLVNSRVEHHTSGGWTMEECEEMKERLFYIWPFPASWTRNLKNPQFHPKERDLERRRYRRQRSRGRNARRTVHNNSY